MSPNVQGFFDAETNTISYVVFDKETSTAAIIDSVLNFDASSGRTSTSGADEVIAFIQRNALQVEWILETHVHADHLSAAPYLKKSVGGLIAIGRHIKRVKQVFLPIFNLQKQSIEQSSAEFDKLFVDGEVFNIGNIQATVMHTPGHTPACISYKMGDVCFVGDTLFMPDYGTARVDFPGGDAETLYDSIQRLFSLPDHTRLFMCHDYKAPGRDDFQWETTVLEQRENNIHVGSHKTREEFVAMRTARDKQLSMPRLILPSIQVNLCAGKLPEPEENGIRYLRIPLNQI